MRQENTDKGHLGLMDVRALIPHWCCLTKVANHDDQPRGLYDKREVPHQKGGTIQNKSRVGRFSARPFNLGIIYSCTILPRTHSQITPTATMSSEDHVKNIAIVGVSVTVKSYSICTESDNFRQAAEWAVRCLRAFCNAVPST